MNNDDKKGRIVFRSSDFFAGLDLPSEEEIRKDTRRAISRDSAKHMNARWENEEYRKSRTGIGNAAFKGKITAIHMETGEKLEFNCITDINESDFTISAISECLSGNREHHKKYKWYREMDQSDLAIFEDRTQKRIERKNTGNEKRKQASKSMWEDPDFKNEMKQKHKNYWSDPVNRAKLSKPPEKHNRTKGITVGVHIETGDRIEMIGAAAIKAAGFNPAMISECINGNRKSHRGYRWHREPIVKDKK